MKEQERNAVLNAAEQKTGFTIHKKDGSSETVYSNCFCISSIDDEESGTNYNVIRGSSAAMFGLVELMQKNEKRLLELIAGDLLRELEKLAEGKK